MKIIIGADIVPTESNVEFFISGEIRKIVDEKVLHILNDADFRIFNLELPIADSGKPIEKQGPNLIAPISSAHGIKKLGVDLVTLANNHIMDYGEAGLKSTIQVLTENKIGYVGAGENLTEAQKPYIIEKDGLKIGVYACAEHEFSIARDNIPGANPFDLLSSFDHIEKLKQKCDYLIVLYHGGKECYRYPSPLLQKVTRKMCDKGADLVVCQHSHCIGCRENYNGSEIIYGQGNFIFDRVSNEYWNSSLLLMVDFQESMSVEYIPLEKTNGYISVTDSNSVLDGFMSRSEEIKREGVIEKKYADFAKMMFPGYVKTICGESFFRKVLNKLTGYRFRKKISKRQRLAMINYIECEAHRELLLKALEEFLDE